MQIEIKELEPCKLLVHYESNSEEIMNKRADVMASFKKAPVPGFRKGKASMDAIRLHYRNQIEESLKRALAEEAYHNTLFEKKLRPHGAPKFNQLLLADGKFTCDFNLLTKPDFELVSYSNLEIPKPHHTETTLEVTEQMLQELRIRFGETIPYAETDFVQIGDKVIVDYEAFIAGQKMENLCAQGEMLTVGSSNLQSIDQNMLGMIMGDVREFDLLVPDNGLPSLAGKTVHLKLTLNMGTKVIPCPLNDELALKLGKKDYNDLRNYVQSMAMARVEALNKKNISEAIANRLVNDNTFQVPNWFSLSEAQYLAHNSKLDWATIPDEDKEKYLEMGERNVRLSLILDKIRETEPEAQLTDQEVFDIIKQNLANTKVQTSLDDVIKEMNRTGQLQILFSRIRDEHALDFITKTTKIIE